MAIAEVGSGSQRVTGHGGNTSTVNITYPANVTADNLLTVQVGSWNSAGHTYSATDSRSTAYTAKNGAGVSFSGRAVEAILYGVAPSSGANTITLTSSLCGSYVTCVIDEFSGAATSSVLDVDGGEATGTGTGPTENLTTATAGALILAATTSNAANVGSYAAGSGYTLQLGEFNSSYQPLAAEFQVVGAAGSYTANFTQGNSQNWAIYAVGIKAPSAGPTIIETTGTEAGTSTVTGAAAAIACATATATGTSTVTGSSSSIAAATGSATGTSTVTGSTRATVAATGTATGTSTVLGQLEDRNASGTTGSAAGTSTVTGVATAIAATTGSATGTSTVTGSAATFSAATGT